MPLRGPGRPAYEHRTDRPIRGDPINGVVRLNCQVPERDGDQEIVKLFGGSTRHCVLQVVSPMLGLMFWAARWSRGSVGSIPDMHRQPVVQRTSQPL